MFLIELENAVNSQFLVRFLMKNREILAVFIHDCYDCIV